jgi:hypothetical protein
LVPAAPAGLTSTAVIGKTGVAVRSEHRMTTQPTHAPHPAPLGCGTPVDVVRWRASRLRDAGFPERLAGRLAHERVDLHALLQLVDRGCPPDLAARILGPDDITDGAPWAP